MAADLLARRCLSRAQDHRNGAAGPCLIDVDRQEAALVVMSIEERELLMAVNDIHRVVDVQGDAFGRLGMARQPQVHQHSTQADDSLQVGQVLQSRAGRLRAQIRPAVGQPPAGKLEGRVAAQEVKVVGVLVAAGDGEDAGAQNVGHRVFHARRITWIVDRRSQPVGQLQVPLGRSQKHDPTIRRDASAVECSSDLLASNGWKKEWQERIVCHGGCGSCDVVGRIGFDTQILRRINSLSYIRQLLPHAVMNKTGI